MNSDPGRVQPDVDLTALARTRPRTDVPPPRRSVWRWLLPLALVLGFAAVLLSTVPDLLRTAREVTVVSPRALTGERARAASATAVVVQAAGWVEPDPFPVQVVPLTPGVVEEVLVQESDVVTRGQVVARLVEEDARLAHLAAMSELARAQADVTEAEATLAIARERYDAALGVTEREAVTRATLEGKRAAAERRAAAVKQGEVRLRLAEDELAVQRELLAVDATGQRQVDLALGRVDEEQALLETLYAEAALARAEVDVAEASHTRAARDLDLRFDDRLAVDVAEARLDRARAAAQAAEARRDEGALRLDRTQVRAPVDGVVLARLAVPGTMLPPAPGEGMAAVCSLYDPRAVRVRVDVPLADVARLFPGQRAEVLSGSRPERPYPGTVLRVVQLADIQKVTLEAQVRVEEPDDLLRPDMLVQVRFLGAPQQDGVDPSERAAEPAGAAAVLVPQRVVDGDQAWVVGPDGKAARRTLVLGARDGEWVEVLEGINLADELIDGGRADLAPGDRLRVREER